MIDIKNRTYAKNTGIQLAGLLLASIVVALSEVMLALSMKRALELLINGEKAGIVSFAALLLATIVAAGFGYYLIGVAGAKFKKKYLYMLKHDYTNAVLAMSLREFSSHSIGEITSKITSDITKLETQYLDTIIKTVRQSTSFVLASVALVYFSPLLAICIYLFAVAIVFLPRKSYQKMGVLGKLYSDSMSKFGTKVQELLGGFAVIKASNMRPIFAEELDQLNQSNEIARYNIGVKEAKITSLLAILSLMTFYIPFLIGAVFVLVGKVEIGVLIAVVNLSGSVINPIQQIGSNIASLKAGQGILQSIMEIINQKSEQTDLRASASFSQLNSFKHKMQLNELTFSYEDREVLANFSAEVVKGRKILLLGASGAGKSTILKLMAGLYDDYSGSITIDGIEIKDVGRQSLATVISFVPQETFIFNRSIRENIMLSKPEDTDKLKKVCQDAALSDCIMQLDRGSDTVLGDGAQSLSGGEKQRVGIARALYQDTDILLVDEPTASLDEANSAMIFDILLNLDKTVVCVTHKISEQQRLQFDEVIILGRV